jgi:hypothetical protein
MFDRVIDLISRNVLIEVFCIITKQRIFVLLDDVCVSSVDLR